jgi:WD40 repeat protein
MMLIGGVALVKWTEAGRATLLAQSAEARADSKLKEVQKTQSLFLAKLAHEQRMASNLGNAIALALEALPDSDYKIARPYVPQPEFELDQAWRALRERLVLVGHEDGVSSAAFSSDGNRIVTASLDKTVRLWDANTGKQIGEPLRGHEGPVFSVAFSTDSERIVTASWDKTARLWDANTGKQIGEPFTGHEDWVIDAAFSLDGKRIVTASWDGTARLWDVDTKKQIGEALKVERYGTQTTTSSGKDCDKHGYENDGSRKGVECKVFTNREIMESAAFSPDGKRIVIATS